MGRRQGGELTTPGARGITMCKLCVPCELRAVWETAHWGCWGHWTLLVLHNSQGTEAQKNIAVYKERNLYHLQLAVTGLVLQEEAVRYIR